MRELRNAIGYIRVSTEQQAGDDKYGIESQKSAILTYADKNGYCVVDWKVDEISGTSDDRPAFNEILDGNVITNPPIEAVIAFKTDRIARDTKIYFYYLYVLEKRGIKLLSTQEDFVEGSEFANIYRSLILFVAEQERRNIALRTGRGRSSKAQCGGYSGGKAPFGYKVENGRLVINEAESKIVEIIFAERAKGASKLSIAEKLNDLGYRSRKGGRLYDTNVRSILDNEMLYHGYYRYGNMKNWVKGVHEPILKDEE